MILALKISNSGTKNEICVAFTILSAKHPIWLLHKQLHCSPVTNDSIYYSLLSQILTAAVVLLVLLINRYLPHKINDVAYQATATERTSAFIRWVLYVGPLFALVSSSAYHYSPLTVWNPSTIPNKSEVSLANSARRHAAPTRHTTRSFIHYLYCRLMKVFIILLCTVYLILYTVSVIFT